MPITGVERERAIRTLCRKAGYAEDLMFGGQPAWMWYLDHVDALQSYRRETSAFARGWEGD